MFKCKVCAEKDKRAQALESEIAFLRSLVYKPVDNRGIPVSNHEANGILDALDRPLEIESHQEATLAEADDVLRERDALLSGSY